MSILATVREYGWHLTVVSVFGLLTAAAHAQLPLGSQAPEFNAQFLNRPGFGTLTDLGGTVTVLYFWTPLMGERVSELARLDTVFRSSVNRGLRVVAVLAFAADSSEARQVIRHLGVSFQQVVADDRMLTDYRVAGRYPTVVVLNRDRAVSRVEQDNYNLQAVLANVEALLQRPGPSAPDRQLAPGRESLAKARRPSPVLCGMAGTGMNAVVPGLAGLVYNRPVDDFWSILPLTFYVVGLSYLIDATSEPKDLLGREDEESYKRAVRTEFRVLVGAYALNIIAGCVVGVKHARH